MTEKIQIKVHGVRFARSLQTAIKMVSIFSAEHKSSVLPVQASYGLLNTIVKQTRYLTVGFVDQRVLMNNILTSETSIKPLENEFLKRGIGAVTFEAGITLAAYKNALAVLAANPKVIEESGGLLPFVETKQLEFVRIFPASKNEIRNKDGDTVLEMGSEEYLISKALAGTNPGFAQGIDSVLNNIERAQTTPASGFQGSFQAIQSAVDQKFETLLKDPGEDPQKAYVDLARLLKDIRPDSIISAVAPPPAGGEPAGPATGNSGGNINSGTGAGGTGTGGSGTGTGGTGTGGTGTGGPGSGGSGAGGGTGGGGFAAGRSEREEVTAEVFQDAALRWAMQRLAKMPNGEEAVVVEEQVFRVLLRSLQATRTASRLANRLAEFAVEYALPRQTYDRLQQELRWITLGPQQKFRELLCLTHFTYAEFRRVLELIKELVKQGKVEDATALGVQYLSIFENHAEIRIEDVSRVPELLRALAGIDSEFWLATAEQLMQALTSAKLNQLIHLQVANALAVLAQTVAVHEDFILVHKAGMALEKSAARDSAAHTACCKAALSNLLSPSAVDRMGEIFLQKKDDSEWIRTAAALLRWSGASAVDRLLAKLETEPIAANRLALMRLLARVGAAGLPPVRRRLTHPDWYVVRNACKILGELKDPELLCHIEPAFQHKDERVQKVAVQIVMQSRMPGRAAALARFLPVLSPSLLESALHELMFLKEPACLAGLEAYLNSPSASGAGVLLKVVQTISGIPDDAAADLLAKTTRNSKFDEKVRAAAREALALRPSLHAAKLLAELAGYASASASSSTPSQLPPSSSPTIDPEEQKKLAAEGEAFLAMGT